MDILEKNKSFNDINGVLIVSFKYLDKGFIYKIITEHNGYIEVFSRNVKSELKQFSIYNFNIKPGKDMYAYVESDILKFNYFRDKNVILALNFISETISKTMLPNVDTFDLYNKLYFILDNINKVNYLKLLLFFVISYLKFNGYYIVFENLNDEKFYYFNSRNFEINNLNSNLDFEYRLKGRDLNFISYIFNNDKIEIDSYDYIDIKRIFGILTNSLCLNLDIKELKSFKFLI